MSEETGKISIAINGTLTRNLTEATLKTALNKVIAKETEKTRFWRDEK